MTSGGTGGGGFFRRLFVRLAGETDQAAAEPHAEALQPEPGQPQPQPQPITPEPPKPEPIAPEPPKPEPLPPVPQPVQQGWFERLSSGLTKSSRQLTTSLTEIFTHRRLDQTTLEELEEVLIRADLGVDLAGRIAAAISQGRFQKEIAPEEVRLVLAAEVTKVLKPVEVPLQFGSERPYVILVVGVNGSGKTTTIGKLGAIAAREGFKVMLAAGDTFRAAAIEQLQIWGGRIGAPVIARPAGSDAAGLAFDALKAAQAEGSDILFIDTAGRLQNKRDLMDELEKIVRVIRKNDASAPHAVLLVLDATTGQNALMQTEVFARSAGVTGLVMTKLDGTAKGGILAAIAERFRLPVHAIGIGEGVDDLQPFDAEAFARAIAGLPRTGAAR
jgi:fused signal recognition particle receptor